MSARIREFVRGNVLGLIAIFIALSGTAYGIHPGGDDTIDSGDIIDRQVRVDDLAGNSVVTGKIVDGQVRTQDVLNDNLTGADIANTGFDQSDDVDADLLDGRSSHQFVWGTAQMLESKHFINVEEENKTFLVPGVGRFTFNCSPGSTAVNYTVESTSPIQDVWRDNGGGDAEYFSLGPNSSTGFAVNGNAYDGVGGNPDFGERSSTSSTSRGGSL